MTENAFFLDTTKCTGCKSCEAACKAWNNLPGEKNDFFEGSEYTNPDGLSAITWNHVKFYPLNLSNPSKPVWDMVHTKCFHCREAACAAACSYRAIYKEEGWTVIDQKKCTGCQDCVKACPFNVPHVSEQSYYVSDVRVIEINRAYKCHGCALNKRATPACASSCPTGALTYGYRLNMLQLANRRLAQVKREFPLAAIYGKTEFGGLRVIAILRDDPQKFGLPVQKPQIKIS